MNSTANAAVVTPIASRARTGWSEEEDALLWSEVQRANSDGRALKSVFDAVAQQTGRKPNSVRNYYYARAKENGEEVRSAAFVPFTQDEIWELLVQVLGDQAKGVSVRACTLRLADGDTRSMLRYQNKYRAVIKSNPTLVREVIAYMKENDMPVFDPYDERNAQSQRAGRPRREAADGAKLIEGMMTVLNIANRLDDLQRRVGELEGAVLVVPQDGSLADISLD